MLLRNRSRAVTKPGLMADHSSQPSSRQNYATPIPSLFGSPKFRELSTKSVSGSGTEALSLRSPTSILDTRALYLSPMGSLNPFSHEAQAIPISSPNKTHSKGIGIGLALVDSLQLHQNSANPNVLFGTQLGVKIPSTLPPSKVSPLESQTSCVHSGLETKHYSLQSPCGCRDSDSPRLVVTGTGVVCWSAMERCEEYTCVKSHGPTPRTTHIFDNCIVIDDTYSSAPLPLYSHSHTHPASGSNDFLSFCYTCKMHLDHTKDIFIYRGEKAFCSEECRYREMVLDGEGNSDVESNDHASL